jgi:hypothetical protein
MHPKIILADWVVGTASILALVVWLQLISGCAFFESRDGQPSPASAAVTGAATGFLTGGPVGAIVGGVGSLIAALGGAYGLAKRGQVKRTSATLEEIVAGIEIARDREGGTQDGEIDRLLRRTMSAQSKKQVRTVKKKLNIPIKDKLGA